MAIQLHVPAYSNEGRPKGSNGRHQSSPLVAVLAVAAIAGWCAVAAVSVPAVYSSAASIQLQPQDLQELAMVPEGHRQTAKRFASNPLLSQDCTSEASNDSFPAARIEGRGGFWHRIASTEYTANWNCQSESSFVKGGFNFTRDDQKLHFPTCGYYHISSQILFQYLSQYNQHSQSDSSANHRIDVFPNCQPNVHYKRFLFGYSSLVQNNFVQTTTYLNDVVRMCEGGWIRVVVPAPPQSNVNLCCADGEGGSTFFTAFLLREMDCI